MASEAALASPSAFDFNKELLCGECGALIVANGLALGVAHFTRSPAWVSAAAVVGTLAGGSLFWLVARAWDRARKQSFVRREMLSDLRWFTPAAIALGLVIYDPAIYATSQYLLRRGSPVEGAVTAGQGVAFGLFLGAMNLYRIALRQVSGKRL